MKNKDSLRKSRGKFRRKKRKDWTMSKLKLS